MDRVNYNLLETKVERGSKSVNIIEWIQEDYRKRGHTNYYFLKREYRR